MSSADNSRVDQAFLGNAMAAFLQISALVVLLLWCFNIVRPFIGIVVWALIIAVALHPLHASLTVKLGGKEKLSATIFTLTGLAIILLPTIMLGESTYEGLRAVGSGLKDGTLDVPPPNASVAEWPFIGEKVYEVWSAGATNLAAAVEQYAEPLKGLAQKVAGIASGMVIGVFQFASFIQRRRAFGRSFLHQHEQQLQHQHRRVDHRAQLAALAAAGESFDQ